MALKEATRKDWEFWFIAAAQRRSASGWMGNRQNHGTEFVDYINRSLGKKTGG